MTKRKWMIEKRESLDLSREQAAKLCNPRDKRTFEPVYNGQVSETLIAMLENDDTCVTHPNIAKRIAKVYGMTKEQEMALRPENYRPGPNYDPDKYKLEIDWGCDYVGGLAKQSAIRAGAADVVG